MKRPDSENRRVLLEVLETVRAGWPYLRFKAGRVHRVKVLLRMAGVPVPRPRKVVSVRRGVSPQMNQLLAATTGKASYTAVAIEKALDAKLVETTHARLARKHEAIEVDIDKL